VIERVGGGRFRILGPLETWNGTAWTGITASKWRQLLAVLLLRRNETVSTDQLISQLWGESPPSGAKNLISVYVLRLRRAIGEPGLLITRPPGYLLAIGADDVDAGRFERLVTDGRRALTGGQPDRASELLTEALGLWRGPALADVGPTPLVAAETDRLQESRLAAEELRAEADLACGRHAEVVPRMRRLLADNPIRERVWALLLHALYGAGRQAEALEAYAKAREVIADELGVDPGAGLQEIYQQILNEDKGEPGAAQARHRGPPVSPPRAGAVPPVLAPAQLPPDIVDFTGRAEQVRRLCDLLTSADDEAGPGAVRVVLVVGTGGLGKTTLAVHAAHQVARDFPDGQLYAGLRGATQPLAPADVLARFLRDLGMDGARVPASLEERTAAFRTWLAGRRMLILLDDSLDADQVKPLLPGSASCVVLVTARGQLPELAGSHVLDLDVLQKGEARVLFGKVAGLQRVQAEGKATERVLAACAGLPLAIRIAGARLAARGQWTVTDLAERLVDERQRLDELRAGNLAVRTCFEVSFAALPERVGPGGVDPARLFRLLGLWTGPSISLPAAAALVGEPEDAAAEALDVLVDGHLLESPEPDQYRFHDLLRVYANARAREQESEQDRRAAVTRLLTWYLHTTEAAAKVISPPYTRVPLGELPPAVAPLEFTTLDQAIAWCEAKRAGLLAGTQLAVGYELHELAWKLPAAAMSFYYRRSHWNDLVTTHHIGLASARALGDPNAEAWMLSNLGIAYSQRRMEESIPYLQEALAIRQQQGDLRGESRAAINVANACFELGRFAEAKEAAQRAVAICRRIGYRYGEGMASEILGCACRELAQYDDAIRHLQEALAISRELGAQNSEADSLSDLGATYLSLGQSGQAVECLQESLSIWRGIGHRYGQAVALLRLGRSHARAGETGAARQSFNRALDLFDELGDQARSAEVRSALAGIQREAS
jgi:DNA-binding SARP family transcriptional activator